LTRLSSPRRMVKRSFTSRRLSRLSLVLADLAGQVPPVMNLDGSAAKIPWRQNTVSAWRGNCRAERGAKGVPGGGRREGAITRRIGLVPVKEVHGLRGVLLYLG